MKTPFIKSSEQVQTEINEMVSEISMIQSLTRAEMIERMAAAYLRMTETHPKDVELVERHDPDGMICWYFRKRGSNN